MKPILVIKMPQDATPEQTSNVTHSIKHHPLRDNYHILITAPELEMYVLNGEEITEMTWEDFKAKLK